MESANKTKRRDAKTIAKFVIFSMIGIFIFFINIKIGEKETVPLIHCIDAIKGLIGKNTLFIIVMLLNISVCVTAIIAKFSKKEKSTLKTHHAKDTAFSYFTYITAAIFSIMVIFNIGPQFIIDPIVGESSVKVASDVITAVIIAGGLVVFLVEYGCLEFLGKLLEPIMRVLFKIPGKAAVDALSSFVASPAVGVMITNSLYKKKVYTAKEACSITTNFSFCSIGAFAFLSSIAGCGDYFPQVVLTALIIGFIMAAIMVRIPPLRSKPDTYCDGTVQTPEERIPEKYDKSTFSNAIETGLEKARETKLSIFPTTFLESARFAQKVSAYVVSLSVICLAIANYTPLIKYIGAPIVPILNLLQIPDAQIIAPSTLVGFFALSLPATLLKGTGVSAMAAFFIVVLSTSQIIFFTESANAMLDSDMPLSLWDLVKIFLIRTAILLPLVAVATHLIF